MDVQNELIKHGYSLDADGITGLKTRSAIMDFQSANGLVADGIAGPNTLKALGLSEVADPIAIAKHVNKE